MSNTSSLSSKPGASNGQVTENSTPFYTESLLLVVVGDQQQWIDPEELLNSQEYADELAEFLETSNDRPTVYLEHLLNIENNARWVLFQFIVDNEAECRVSHGRETKQYTDLFKCSLDLIVSDPDLLAGDPDPERCGRGRTAALDAAVLVHPNNLEFCCSQIAKRFKKLGVTGVRTADLLSEAKQVHDGLEEEEVDTDHPDLSYDLSPVFLALPGAPVSGDVEIPEGWELNENGISKKYNDELINCISAPVMITFRYIDSQSAEHFVDVTWLRDGRWHTKRVKRDVIANTKSIIELAAYGLPVTSVNAPSLVAWLTDFETKNLQALHLASVSQQLGWQGKDGEDGFLLGNQLINAKGEIILVGDGSLEPEKVPQGLVVFQGADEGDTQLANGFRQAGSYAGWRDAVSLIGKYPRALLTLYTALVPPLLLIFKVPNFLLDLCGTTSTGKTTALEVAASLWGCPDKGETAAVMKTWDNTLRWFERSMEMMNNVPVFADDTKEANKDELGQIIYYVTSGRGRGRATRTGTEYTSTFRTVLLLNGEAPATSYTQDGGARARVLTMWGMPFGETSRQTAKDVQVIHNGVMDNFGHAGPLFVSYLAKHREQWTEWRELYEQDLATYQEWAGENAVAHRMSPMFAAIGMAAWLAHKALELPWEYSDPIEPIWNELVGEAAEADRAKAALRYAFDYACSHQDDFCNSVCPSQHDRKPSRGWLGRWDVHVDRPEDGGAMHYEFLGYLPERLRSVLAEAGFDAEAVIRTWKDRSWIMFDASSGKAI